MATYRFLSGSYANKADNIRSISVAGVIETTNNLTTLEDIDRCVEFRQVSTMYQPSRTTLSVG